VPVRAAFWWLLGAAGLLLVLSRTQKGQQIAADAVGAVASAVRGIRNNNPGNIRPGGGAWQGLRTVQTDTGYLQFTEMRFGVRAAAKLFRNYQANYGLRSVAQMIARWAPSVENDTASYINAVAQRVGVDAYAQLDLKNSELCYRFLRAVFRHECGIAAEAIPEATIREGISLA
jgi:hypothetical protein